MYCQKDFAEPEITVFSTHAAKNSSVYCSWFCALTPLKWLKKWRNGQISPARHVAQKWKSSWRWCRTHQGDNRPVLHNLEKENSLCNPEATLLDTQKIRFSRQWIPTPKKQSFLPLTGSFIRKIYFKDCFLISGRSSASHLPDSTTIPQKDIFYIIEPGLVQQTVQIVVRCALTI